MRFTRGRRVEEKSASFSLNVGGTPGTLSHLGIRYPGTGDVASEMVRVKQANVPLFQQEGTPCCYAKADKFWVKDGDGIPWEMYALLEDVQAETAADPPFLGQETTGDGTAAPAAGCCVPTGTRLADDRRQRVRMRGRRRRALERCRGWIATIAQ